MAVGAAPVIAQWRRLSRQSGDRLVTGGARTLTATTGREEKDVPCMSCITDAAPPDLAMSVQIADLSAGDIGTIQQVFAGLSAQSSYQRYQSARPTLPIQTQRRLADVRPGRHVAHVAMLGGRPVGIVRWIRS